MRLTITGLLLVTLLSSNVTAQTSAAFLVASPSPRQSVMGGTGVALPMTDAFHFAFNPAQLGLSSTNTALALGYSVSADAPSLQLFRNNFALHAGYDLSRSASNLPVSVGVGAMRMQNFTGLSLEIDSLGREGRLIESNETATLISVGASYNKGVRISVGLTLKFIGSALVPEGFQGYDGRGSGGTGTTLDYGLMISAPLPQPVVLTEHLALTGDVSLGYAALNAFGSLKYRGGVDNPLPKTAKLGYAARATLLMRWQEKQFSAVAAEWSAEANDLLVKSIDTRQGGVTQYQDGLGDIDIWKHVITLQESAEVQVRYGWRVGLFETLELSGGKAPVLGIIAPSSFGWSVRTNGLFKLLAPAGETKSFRFFTHVNFLASFGRYTQGVFADIPAWSAMATVNSPLF